MKSAWQTYVDDLPDFILAGFGDVKRTTGRYPRRLIVSQLLAEIMHVSVGVWGPTAAPGVWGWIEFLDPEDAIGIDEFGQPEN